MLLIKKQYFSEKPTLENVARKAGLHPETLCRIVNGKQKPGYKKGQSAERIAAALGWRGNPAELFQEVD